MPTTSMASGVLSRRFGLTVYINDETRQASAKRFGQTGRGLPVYMRDIPLPSATWPYTRFSISHDAEDPAGFTIGCDGAKVGLATDLGIATAVVRTHLAACDILVLEANHDTQMLIDGPYPWPLKQRIRGRSGHLSNDDAALLLESLQHDRLAHVILAHLSEENNTAEKARRAISAVLNGAGVELHVASQMTGTRVLTVG
jgi:phosphoribosyl 1,2-cyclic phosphodiesterase